MTQMTSTTTVVIGIPTFRRPEGLKALLDSLVPQLEGMVVQVIVADNDCGTQAPAVVESFKDRIPSAVCLPVKARGVSQVRNALVEAADRLAPQWQWLVMYDDDGVLTPGALANLLSAGERFGAHLVGGVVDGGSLSQANLLARHSIFAARHRWATGLVPRLNGAQNIALSRKLFDLMQPPFFRNEYGASGGEDYDFFRRTSNRGGKIAWCNESVVLEPPTPAQITVKGLLNRYFTTGTYMVVIDRSYDGARTVWLQASKGLVSASLRLVWGAVRFNGPAVATGILSVAHYCGRLAGLFGARSTRYVNPQQGA